MQKTMWARITVWRPSLKPIATKKSSVATAVTTSGTTSGSAMTALLAFWPRNRLAMPSAAMVARIVEPIVAAVATISEFFAAAMIVLLTKTSAYQAVVNPVQIVAARFS